MIREYRTIGGVVGPLMAVEKVAGVRYGELIEIRMQSGEIRREQVLEVQEDKAMVQIFEGTSGINLRDSSAWLLGHPLELGVPEDTIGRVFDGLGHSKDNGSEILPEKYLDINGEVTNPVVRDYPDESIQTGIPAIGHLNTLVRGQKLPVFSGSGLPHKELTAQIARQATVLDSSDDSVVVFAATGITFEEVEFFVEDFRQTGAINRSVMFMNLANGPAIECIATPRMALTVAEYLAYEKGMHVLVIITDMINYAEVLREISAARWGVPGRRDYSGYLYTNLTTLFERAGRIHELKGSVTQVPILTVSEDDKIHPIPDLTGYITEGQIILTREPYKSGIQLLIDALLSLSRLKDRGAGPGKIREDHVATMNRLSAAYAQGKQAKELTAVLGESALSDVDRIYAKSAERFEKEYVNQGFYTNRSITETLDLGWELLLMLPKIKLKRIKDDMLDKYLPEGKWVLMVWLNVNPTRMELTRPKKQLTTATRGHKLLKDKQDELMRQFILLIRKNSQPRQEMEGSMIEAMSDFVLANASITEPFTEELFALSAESVDLSTVDENIMSVKVPVMNFEYDEQLTDSLLEYGYLNSSAELDRSIDRFTILLPKLLELTEIEKTYQLMASEIEKIRRQVNVLEYMTISQLEEMIYHIRMKLEENECAEATRLAKVENMGITD